MKEYELCPVCGLRYSVSQLRDKSKVFICQDCAAKRAGMLYGRKQKPIYNRNGFATVRSE